MIFRLSDPLDDFRRHDAELNDYESKCPVCDGCRDPITSGTYIEVMYKGKILRFCEDCVSTQYVSHYIEERGSYQDE